MEIGKKKKMSLYEEIKEGIRKEIRKITKEKIFLEEIEESKEGDFSFRTFKLGKKLNKNSEKISKEISKRISLGDYLDKVEAKGPYVNFFLDYSKLIVPLLRGIEEKEEEYGKGKAKEKKIILEHTSINPSGPVHVGRLRNSLIGDSLARILKFYGFKVETHFYVNDIGKQIAIIAQGYKEGLELDKSIIEKYKEYKDKDDFKVFFEYVSAYRKFMENESFQKKVQSYIKRAESGDKRALNEIREVAKKCLEGQKETFHKLGIFFDSFDFESKYLEDGSVEKILDSLRKSEYAKEEEGGFGLSLEEFGLKRRGKLTILARKDKTSVYLSRDLAYHLEKEKLGDILINVLGEDHKFEFLELKTILEKFLNLRKPLKVIHYAFVNFEGEELSTRKGSIAPVDRLIDEAIKKAEEEIEKRKIADKEKVAPVIGIGAIKYHLLKTTPLKPITFKWDEVLNFEGESCPYIQYAHARSCSILRKSGRNLEEIKAKKINKKNLSEEEKFLLKELMKFPHVIKKAAQELKPNIIANFLYELSVEFSRFYKNCQVLGVSDKRISERRLLLVNSTRIVIKNGLNLLGIGAPEKM
jgi:arginyl-tRNA synthetase